MKLWKKTLALLLSAALLLGCCAFVGAEEHDCPSKDFTDVPPEGNWAHEGIDFMVENGYMKGTGEQLFSPKGTTTRAMIVQILHRMAGEPASLKVLSFADVPEGKWFYNAVRWAVETGVSTGVSETAFNPNGSVTREQIASFLARNDGVAADYPTDAINAFSDADRVSGWAKTSVAWAIDKGIINGKGSGDAAKIDPKGKATRAEVATMIYRYASLAPALDKQGLTDALEAAAKYDLSNFTDESAAALTAAIQAGVKAETEAATQQELDDAARAILDAIAALAVRFNLTDIDFTKLADAEKYEILGQSSAAPAEGVGVALVTTRNAFETCNGQNSGTQATTPEDVVAIPVSGNWIATLKVDFDQNGASNGYYQFFGFYAAEGDDYRNLAGIRGGNNDLQDFLRVDGEITADTEGIKSSPGFGSNGTYYLRLEKHGDHYICFRSSDGETFTELFRYEDTGIEADRILIDAYTGMTTGYKFTLKTLTFLPGKTSDPHVLDKTVLEAAIKTAEETSVEGFTAKSVARLQEAIESAKQVLAEATRQKQLDAAVSAIQAAIQGLTDKNWVSTWATAEENFTASSDRVPNTLNGTTVRQIIRVTTAGTTMRLRLSNQYGNTDVVIHSMHLARQVQADKPEIDVSTDTPVTVGGQEEFSIPAGQTILTDPVTFPVNALDNVAITAYFGNAPTTAATITGHRGARCTTYQISGDHVSDQTFTANKTILSWYFLSEVQLDSPEDARAIVCFGDSITDGYGTDADYLGRKPDEYTRWGDYFAKRLQADEKTKNVSVLNEGIGANSMFGGSGPAGKDRYARDLLEHEGVEYVIILYAVNDLNRLNNTSMYERLRVEFEKMITLAHENGIKVYAAPILPFGNYSSYYSESSEQVRTMINDWFRSADSKVDGIIDFESAVADPTNPKIIKPEYTSDGLHPEKAYDVMANAIDLSMFYE